MPPSPLPQTLLILGCGYVGKKLAKTCMTHGIKVKATVRDNEQALSLHDLGIEVQCLDNPALAPASWLSDCDALIDSIPLSYDAEKHPFQTQSHWVPELLANMSSLNWAGYLSSTAVYADSGGDWIDERCLSFSSSARGRARLDAEQAWLQSSAPAEVFRLAGIYGNDRNILSKLMAGNYKTIHWDKPHYSNRIHVDDIVATLMAAMSNPKHGRILNVADDYPSSHEEYASVLAESVGAPEPVIIEAAQAEKELSPAYLTFFQDNKRISNRRLHQELLPALQYPGFRNALPHLKV